MYRRVCLGRVPILTFHSVRRRRTEELGAGGELTMPDDVFEAVLAKMRRGGYRAVTCSELHAHLSGGAALPARPVLLTFDDGYLDNHSFAAPLLRRYGLRGTVFVATDFLHPEEGAVRPTADDHPAPPERGYLSPAELRRWQDAGVLEFQSHTASHARLPVSPEVVDFHRPQAPCLWMARNRADPSRRPFEQHGGLDGAVPWGAPVYRSEWASAARAWHPDPALERALAGHVAERGGARFFERPGWREELQAVVARGSWGAGRPESAAESRTRIVDDLRRSKRRLEEILGRPVDFLAWPGGGSSPAALDLALQEAGYKATFGTDRPGPGVTPGLQAIPRAYLRQNYRGRLSRSLRASYARGVADWESGRWRGYPRIFGCNRLMNLLADPRRPNRG